MTSETAFGGYLASYPGSKGEASDFWDHIYEQNSYFDSIIVIVGNLQPVRRNPLVPNPLNIKISALTSVSFVSLSLLYVYLDVGVFEW